MWYENSTGNEEEKGNGIDKLYLRNFYPFPVEKKVWLDTIQRSE